MGTANSSTVFDNISILAVGNIYQLQPVGQYHMLALPSDDNAKLHGSIWKEHFKTGTLTESMRQ